MSSQDEEAIRAAEILTKIPRLSNTNYRITSDQQSNTSKRIVTNSDVNRRPPPGRDTPKQPAISNRSIRNEAVGHTLTHHEPTQRRFDIRTRRGSCNPRDIEEPRKFYFIEELVKHDSIIFNIATQYLRPRDVLNLYSISKAFFFIVNHKLPSFILASARRWADLTPHGQRKGEPNLRQHSYDRFDITTQLPFNAFRHLCVVDPSLRILPGAARRRDRHVPSFRYLFFVVHRANTIKSICYQMALRTLRLPLDIAPSVLAKIGFLMDFATNGGRIGLVHSPTYWTNNDLYVGIMICMKLDMAFSDPIEGENGQVEALMRQMMLAQRSLSTLNKVLRREKMRTQVELLRMWVEWKYIPELEHSDMPIMGLPPHKIGHLQFEGWGQLPASARAVLPAEYQANTSARYRTRNLLMRPDQLIVRESVRRGLHLETHLMDMLFWGFVDSETLEDIDNIGASLLNRRKGGSIDALGGEANEAMDEDDMSDDGTGWSRLELMKKPTESDDSDV